MLRKENSHNIGDQEEDIIELFGQTSDSPAENNQSAYSICSTTFETIILIFSAVSAFNGFIVRQKKINELSESSQELHVIISLVNFFALVPEIIHNLKRNTTANQPYDHIVNADNKVLPIFSSICAASFVGAGHAKINLCTTISS